MIHIRNSSYRQSSDPLFPPLTLPPGMASTLQTPFSSDNTGTPIQALSVALMAGDKERANRARRAGGQVICSWAAREPLIVCAEQLTAHTDIHTARGDARQAGWGGPSTVVVLLCYPVISVILS